MSSFYACTLVGCDTVNAHARHTSDDSDDSNGVEYDLSMMRTAVGHWYDANASAYREAVSIVCGTLPEKFAARPCPGFAFARGRRPASRAYAKLWEILEELPIRCHVRTSAHLCEAPGGFVQATMDVARPFSGSRTKLTLDDNWRYYAVSLSPEAGGLDWRLTRDDEARCATHAPLDGDIIDTEDVAHADLITRCRGECQLVTADGGFDVDFTGGKTQEDAMFNLVRREFEVALILLSSDPCATCVIKLFDVETTTTRDLLARMAILFDQAWIVKPASSRPVNAERYFVGVGLRDTEYLYNRLNAMQEVLGARQCAALHRVRNVLHPRNRGGF